MRFSFKIRNQKNVAVFLFLGEEPKDRSKPLDTDAVLKGMGWKWMPHDE